MAPISLRSRSAPTPDVDIDPTSPDFQAETLRVPELKALLANHNIRLASSARKADLVKAVNENIVEPHRQAEEDQRRAKEEEEELKRRAKLEKEQQRQPKSPSTNHDPPRNFSTENPFQQSPSTDSKQTIKRPRQSLPAQRSVAHQKPSAAAASRRKVRELSRAHFASCTNLGFFALRRPSTRGVSPSRQMQWCRRLLKSPRLPPAYRSSRQRTRPRKHLGLAAHFDKDHHRRSCTMPTAMSAPETRTKMNIDTVARSNADESILRPAQRRPLWCL